MKHLYVRTIVAAMLMASSATAIAAPAKPAAPLKPAMPPKPTPPPAQPDSGPTSGEIIMCMATGNSMQICMAGTTIIKG